jgi:hypothetical protein
VALDVASTPVRILVAPKLVVRISGTPFVGSPVRVIATLHPASAETVKAPRVLDTRARIPMWIAQTVYAQVAYGSEVIVYT